MPWYMYAEPQKHMVVVMCMCVYGDVYCVALKLNWLLNDAMGCDVIRIAMQHNYCELGLTLFHQFLDKH